MSNQSSDDKQTRIPESKIGRVGVAGVTTTKAGLKKLEYMSKSPFLSDEDRDKYREKNQHDIARTILKGLSRLKGAPLKLAQMISMELDLLPEAFRRELSKCADSVPPMNRALIRKVLTRELGDVPEKVFSKFESTPFASASLGQVHRALSHDGKELAVKVQYPGISRGMKTDIEMFRSVVSMSPYSQMIESALPEIEERLFEELDYRLEALNTEFFHRSIPHNNIIVPEVVGRFSSDTVLTTSKIEGMCIDRWLEKKPSARERNHYGQLLCDVFAHNVRENRMIQADPNTGNFLFRDDGKLGLIDFGCVKKIDDDFIACLKELSGAIDSGNLKRAEELYREVGIFCSDSVRDDRYREIIPSWLEWITRPVRSEFFDFGENENYFREGRKFLPLIKHTVERFDGRLLFYGRFEYGLYRILHRLKARVVINLYN